MVFLRIEGQEDFYEIFDLEISHREGELALATVVVAENCWHMCQADVVRIMSDDKVLFCGKPLSFPKKIDGACVKLQFVANCDDFKCLINEFKESDDYRQEFSDGCDVAKELTETFPCRFCFNRSDGSVKLTDILPDKDTIEIHESECLSLQMRACKEPISRINVSVDAQWIQECRGMTDLYPIIAKHFEQGFINSLNNLQRQWWRMSKSLPKSCYTVVHSHIQEYFPPCVRIREHFKVGEKDVYIKRFWFRGVLDLRWHYQQKICEQVNFSIHDPKSSGKVEKNIVFHLKKIDIDKSLGSYFKTENGKKSLVHAAKRALNHLIASNRSIEVSINGDFEKLSRFHVGDCVKICRQSNYIFGRIVHFCLKCTSNTRFICLKIASSIGEISLPNLRSFFDKNVPKDDEKPPLSVDDVVEKVVVNNPPEMQIASVRHIQNETIADLKRTIISIPTSIRVKLKNLNMVKCLHKKIDIEEDLCVNNS